MAWNSVEDYKPHLLNYDQHLLNIILWKFIFNSICLYVAQIEM